MYKMKIQLISVLIVTFLASVNSGNYLQHLFKHKKMLIPPKHFHSSYCDKKQEESTRKEYDFIIIGAGPSGIVLANRLSEIYSWNILLLEAGQAPNILTDIPVIAPIFQFTDYNWGYLAEKQHNMSLGLEDQRMHWPRGKGLGGSSIINYMIAVRGNPRDYDRWASMGNPGWSYQEVLPYFIKLENSSKLQTKDRDVRGETGFLNIEDIPYRSESVHAFVKAAQEAGHDYVDYNGHDQLGVSYVQGTIRDSARCDAYKAYLEPVKFRPNLTIRTGCRVTKVLIDPSTRKTYGVEYYKTQKRYTATVTKEVILSAGAFNSPQLLMLSGIGPRTQLQKFEIPVLQDLPVGRKLYDHLAFLGLTYLVDKPISLLENFAPLTIWRYLQLYFLQGTGTMASIGVEAVQYVKTSVSQDPDPKFPDIELLFMGGALHTDYGLYFRRAFRISDETYYGAYKHLEGKPAWNVFPMLLHPKSYGWLELQSADPFVPPKLYGNYLTDPEGLDMKSLIAAIREVQRIAAEPSLQRYRSRLVTTKIPGCQHLVFDTDDYWECAIRHISSTFHNQVATCKMGPATDHEAVVNHELKVYGVSNLRVVDTSVIPLMISAHTNVPSFMIGEKAADLVKKDWSALNIEGFLV